MKFLKSLSVLFLFLFFQNIIFIKTTEGKSKLAVIFDPPVKKIVIPPSPNAAAMAKFADIPVGPHSGTTGISIPIWNFSGRKLSVPISLNYHTAGIKVDERASNVGLGWTLQAGGMITRTVRGLPDEDIEGYFNIRNQIANGTSDSSALYNWGPSQVFSQQVSDAIIDTEPDLYFFNINGRTGQILFDSQGNAFTNPYSKIKFEASIYNQTPYWVLITEDGTRYTFGDEGGSAKATEYTESNFGHGSFNQYNFFPSTWHLTKIKSAFGDDEIIFNYEDDNVSYPINGAQIGYKSIDQKIKPAEVATHDLCISIKRLKEIIAGSGRIEFLGLHEREDLAGSLRIDSITVFDIEDIPINHFKLKYAYRMRGQDTDSKRLFLTELNSLVHHKV